LTDCAVLQVEHDDMFDGIEDLIPRGAERLGRFLPRKPTRPAAEEQQIGLVNARLPSPHGTSSTITVPQRRQLTRRMVYRRQALQRKIDISACRIAVRTYHFVGLFSQSDGFVLRECQTPYVHLDGNAEARCVPRCKQVLRRGGVGQSGSTHFLLDRQVDANGVIGSLWVSVPSSVLIAIAIKAT
jgi:hypothetical protein